MAGAFATWQPLYEEAGIATFPVDATRKSPSVGNYMRAGLPASREWARKFGDSTALGFNCGRRNKITVLDIDAPDENLLANCLDKFGPSPVIIKTASNKFHVWYKHNGEKRLIRPDKSQPIDILGGGYAVAPPSNANGGAYEFIQGSLADLASLPVMRSAPVETPLETAQDAISGATADSGGRNDALFRTALRLARNAAGVVQLIEWVSTANKTTMNPPLDDSEVMQIAASAWDYQQTGKNWSGSGRRIVKSFDEMDAFAPMDGPIHKTAPDALLLLDLLRRLHWGRDTFVVANAMHEKLGWPRKRFTAARSYLVNMGKLRVVKHPSKDTPAIYAF